MQILFTSFHDEEEGFIKRTFENLPNEGRVFIRALYSDAQRRSPRWFYGIQLER